MGHLDQSYRYLKQHRSCLIKGDGIIFLLLPQHYQYIGKGLEDEKNRSTDERFRFPSLKDTVEDILNDSKRDNKDNTHFSTVPFCLPQMDTGPVGSTKLFPAQDCEHIQRVNTTAVSGFFWIDPNLGCSLDSISVYCNFSSNETCIFPRKEEVFLLARKSLRRSLSLT